MARPAPVTIDDFARPRFTADVLEIRAGAAPIADALVFDADAMCADAAAQTGLDEFGDPGFLERLRVLVGALDREGGFSPFGQVAIYVQLVQLLKNRLLLEDLLRRHPEIHDVQIERPIVIAGLPRTGTTHLHNLVSADPSLRSLPYWESIEPVLAEAERPAPGEPDPRLERCAAGLAMVDLVMPYFERMHEMTVDHVHEEIQLLAVDFSTMLFETMAPIPTWRDYYRAHDQTPHYEYLRTILKALQWLRGGTRWVLKSPQHLECFGPLVRVFPDATFVVTHRDPVDIVVSLVTMMTYTARMHHDEVDVARYATYWTDRAGDLLRSCVEDRDLLPAERTLDVRFDDFMADDVATVEHIYAVAEQPFDASVRAAMERFMASHPRGRHGTVVYDLARFGIDGVRLRRDLAAYCERFGV